MNKSINWLHLSDIHFTYSNFNTIRMRDRLLYKLKEISKDIDIAFIVITGDIVFKHGKYTQDIISFINSILEVSALKKENLFIVPGNHDVLRNSTRNAIINTIQNSSEYTDFDEVLEKDLLKAQKDFFSFYKKVKGEPYPSTEIHWVFQGDHFNIVHLNTALTCGQDGEEGKLKINLLKLFSALKKVQSSSNINIAIGHHGLDCFSETDKEKAIYQFDDYNIDLYLCGHIHKSSFSISADGTREIPTIFCGSNVVDGYSKASFILESFDHESSICKASYFCWDNENDQWVLDSKVGRKIVDGTVKFAFSRFKLEHDNIPSIDDDDFRRFIAEFHDNIDQTRIKPSEIFMKDIEEKFSNMKCNKTVKSQYSQVTIYFPIINQVMESASFMSAESKMLVTSVLVEEYNKVFDFSETGTQILESMAQNIFTRYKNKLQYSEARLKMYIKILIYWLIYECDIFDDFKE